MGIVKDFIISQLDKHDAFTEEIIKNIVENTKERIVTQCKYIKNKHPYNPKFSIIFLDSDFHKESIIIEGLKTLS